jgi:chemotaxis protein CheX
MNSDVNATLPTSGIQQRNREWCHALFEAAAEVFEMMVGEPVSLEENPDSETGNDTTAMVGLAGALCGVLSIRCRATSAASIASKMLGEPAQSSECVAQQLDALGEICNMVAGNFKARIEGLREQCMLSVPTVITGQDYCLHSVADDDRLEVALLYQGQPVLLRLEMHG